MSPHAFSIMHQIVGPTAPPRTFRLRLYFTNVHRVRERRHAGTRRVTVGWKKNCGYLASPMIRLYNTSPRLSSNFRDRAFRSSIGRYKSRWILYQMQYASVRIASAKRAAYREVPSRDSLVARYSPLRIRDTRELSGPLSYRRLAAREIPARGGIAKGA